GATLEIGVADGGVFDRAQKYDGTAAFTVPAHLTDHEAAAIDSAARALYEALGCAGVARFDFFVTPGGVVLNEVNTTPGFTEHSQVPRMYAATGMGYVELVAALLDAAIASTDAVSAPSPVML
ncbi:MAG: ATP-grasp domain-containing protein, partial [Leifsonia sp.]|nr:ATP-grasp domain-containing protein [Leifsonia sp.]